MGKTKPYVLPDTNIFIYALSGREPYAGFFRKLVIEQRVLLSSIVVAEFLAKATDEEERLIANLWQEVRVVPVDLAVAQLAGQIRKKSLSAKKRLHLPDCLIAAQCQLYGALLATYNPADFPKNVAKVEIK